jgi:hypothetical protein
MTTSAVATMLPTHATGSIVTRIRPPVEPGVSRRERRRTERAGPYPSRRSSATPAQARHGPRVLLIGSHGRTEPPTSQSVQFRRRSGSSTQDATMPPAKLAKGSQGTSSIDPAKAVASR